MKYKKELNWTSAFDKEGQEIFKAKSGKSVLYQINDETLANAILYPGKDKKLTAVSTTICEKLGLDNGLFPTEASLIECFNYLSTDGSREKALATAKKACADDWQKKFTAIEKNSTKNIEN